MKTQISRDSRQPAKRYSGVYQQQGRMLTDSDINEQVDIDKHRLEHSLEDVIGSGTPAEGGLAINADASIQPGKAYVEGVPAEIQGDTAITYDNQEDYTNAPPITESDYLLYLDVWDRAVTGLEDEALIDPGLHGADTCTRTQTMTQVRWCPAAKESQLLSLPKQGDAPLTLTLRDGSEGGDDCDPCASLVNVDTSVGNYLFRVEVHHVRYSASGKVDRLTLKWSSENGAEQYKIGYEPADFTSGNWIYELFNETAEKHLGAYLSPTHGDIKRGELAETYSGSSSSFDYVRRWDGYIELMRVGANWQSVKDGATIRGMDKGVRLKDSGDADALGYVSIANALTANLSSLILNLQLKSGSTHDFLAGDFWWAPLREREEYSSNVVLSQALPSGIEHHYLILASVSGGAAVSYTGDVCKPFGFPKLTDLHAEDICYEDGCENLYGTATNVKEALDNLCTHLDASDIPFQNNCTNLYHSAENVQDALNELCKINANDIAFSGKCSALTPATNVAQALELLCEMEKGGGCVHVVGEGGDFLTLDEAFKALEKEATVVLCLLPGDHPVALTQDRTFQTLKIVGSGAASSRVIAEEGWKIVSEEIIFRDLSVSAQKNNAQIHLIASGVDVQGCVFERLDGDKDALSVVLVSSEKECVVSWENNHVTSIWKHTDASTGNGELFLPKDETVLEGGNLKKAFAKLAQYNAAVEGGQYEDTLDKIAAEIANMPVENRKKWGESRPKAMIRKLPNKKVRHVKYVRSLSVGAKARAGGGRYAVEMSKVGARDAVNGFYKELVKGRASKGAIMDFLDNGIKATTTTGFGRCLGLADSMITGTVRDNLFEGELVLNEFAADGLDLGDNPFTRPHPELEYPVHPDSTGTLRITGNAMSRVLTLIPASLIGGQDTTNPWLGGAMDTWRSMFVSENVLTDPKSSFAAWSISVQGNHFDLDDEEVKDQGAFVMSYFATLTGNIGPGQGDNLMVRIVTFGANEAKSANLVQII